MHLAVVELLNLKQSWALQKPHQLRCVTRRTNESLICVNIKALMEIAHPVPKEIERGNMKWFVNSRIDLGAIILVS